MKSKQYSVLVGGKTITAEFTDLAENAHGSVIIRCGNTVILATAVISKKPKEGSDFFPLTVDYEERFYAIGQILGSQFIRREGKPSDEAVLSGRIVDRTIRPLFDWHIRHEVQVVITVLSLGEYDPDILSVLGTSLALGTSEIPWNGPVGAVRIGKHKEREQFEVNPTYGLRQDPGFCLDIIACGKEGTINMIEVGAHEATEEIVNKGLEQALKEITIVEKWQKDIIKEIGKKKIVIEPEPVPASLALLFKEHIAAKLQSSVMTNEPGKNHIENLKEEWVKLCEEKIPEESALSEWFYEEQVNELIHAEAIEHGKRPDGRGIDEVRSLFAQAGGISPILHGSGIFYRGGTHILSVLTLGGPGDSQTIDGMEAQTTKRFMHHYNFPPFSTGETGRVGSTNRRMIGHGALAEKAIIPVLPAKEVFPYTIRVVSEAFSSNGSTSMGSVCGTTLALMDAGVPILRPVAGIASGLMMSLDYARDKKYAVLTDIQGPEDHHGDMDFKVAGTTEGITAVQMDVKVDGVPLHILKVAFEKAKTARLKILKVMTDAIPTPRKDIAPSAPKIIAIKIKPDQIGLVIGGGGKTINEIREKTGTEIDIEEDGTVFITGKDGGAEKAAEIIASMTKEYKAGETFEGEVMKITEFGAFVKIAPNTEGLVHVSEIAPFRIEKVGDVLKEGMRVPVIIKGIDEKGRMKLSIKDRDPNFIKKPSSQINAPSKPK